MNHPSLHLAARDSLSDGFLADLTMLGASAMWGIGVSQTFKFLFDIRKESKRLVFLVLWLCLTDTLRQSFSVYSSLTIYLNTAVYFQAPGERSAVALTMAYMFAALSAVSAQLFFMLRIWRLYNNNVFIPIISTPIILFQLCVPLVYFEAISPTSKTSITAQKDLLIATLVTGAVVDVALSAALCGLLWRHYMAGGPVLKSTKAMLQRMILFSVNTGMWTALVACMVIFVFFRTAVSDFTVFGYFHVLSPLYFATVLANLNARAYLSKRREASLPSDLVRTSGSGSEGHVGVATPQAISGKGHLEDEPRERMADDDEEGELIHLRLIPGSQLSQLDSNLKPSLSSETLDLNLDVDAYVEPTRGIGIGIESYSDSDATGTGTATTATAVASETETETETQTGTQRTAGSGIESARGRRSLRGCTELAKTRTM